MSNQKKNSISDDNKSNSKKSETESTSEYSDSVTSHESDSNNKNEGKSIKQGPVPRGTKKTLIFYDGKVSQLRPKHNLMESNKIMGREHLRGGGDDSFHIPENKYKIDELRNKNYALMNTIHKLQVENRGLMRIIKKQERFIQNLHNQEDSMPNIIERQDSESRAMYMQMRVMKKKMEDQEEKLKIMNKDLERNEAKMKKLTKLAEDKKLLERDELRKRLEKADREAEIKSESLKNMERHLQHLCKNHKHELGLKKAKQQAADHEIEELKRQIEKLSLAVKEKDKEMAILYINSNHTNKRLVSSIRSTPLLDTNGTPKYSGKPIKVNSAIKTNYKPTNIISVSSNNNLKKNNIKPPYDLFEEKPNNSKYVSKDLIIKNSETEKKDEKKLNNKISLNNKTNITNTNDKNDNYNKIKNKKKEMDEIDEKIKQIENDRKILNDKNKDYIDNKELNNILNKKYDIDGFNNNIQPNTTNTLNPILSNHDNNDNSFRMNRESEEDEKKIKMLLLRLNDIDGDETGKSTTQNYNTSANFLTSTTTNNTLKATSNKITSNDLNFLQNEKYVPSFLREETVVNKQNNIRYSTDKKKTDDLFDSLFGTSKNTTSNNTNNTKSKLLGDDFLNLKTNNSQQLKTSLTSSHQQNSNNNNYYNENNLLPKRPKDQEYPISNVNNLDSDEEIKKIIS